MRPLTPEMKKYRRAHWYSAPIVVDLDFVCTNCLGKNRDQEVRETPTGIWCERHYLELPSCDFCFEPVIRICDENEDGLKHLCRDHYQYVTYGTSALPILDRDVAPKAGLQPKLRIRRVSEHPAALPSKACYKIKGVTVHCYGANGGFCQCGAHEAPNHWS